MRIEIAGELIQAFRPHIRDIDITDLTVRRLIHLLDIILDPIIMIQRILFRQRTDYDLTSARQLRLAIQRQLGRNVRLSDQQLIHIVHAIRRYSVYSDDILSGLRLNTRLCQWRT